MIHPGYQNSFYDLLRLRVQAIPEEFAEGLADRLELETDTSIVQTNVVSHTGASVTAVLPGHRNLMGRLFLMPNMSW